MTVKATGRVASRDDDIIRMLSEDVTTVLAQTVNCEIEEQKRLENPLTHLRLNGKPANRIRVRGRGRGARGGQYLWNASMLFSGVSDMIPAAQKAIDLLTKLTRVRSGRARGSYRIYLGNIGNSNNPGQYLGNNLAGISNISESDLSNVSVISIVGPWVPYARVLHWNPAGSKSVVKRFPTRGLRAMGISLRGGFIGTETIHTDVKKRMRRIQRYKGLSFGDPWYEMPGSPVSPYPRRKPDSRIPAITIKVKKSGRVN